MKEGDLFVALEDRAGLHIIGDGNDETFCGRPYDPEGDWWIASCDGDWTGWCSECVRALDILPEAAAI